MERPCASLDVSVPCDQQAPGAVRRAMESMSAIGSSLPDAMLIVSELVTNTVRSSRDTGHGAIAVSVRRFSDHLVIRVSDHEGTGPSAEPPYIPEIPVDGYGQRIVERLASRWGTDGPDGVVSWAELPLTVSR